MAMPIHEHITIEDLVREYPRSVKFLAEKGIKCIACGEPIWGTLRDAAVKKGYGENEIEQLVEALKEYVSQ